MNLSFLDIVMIVFSVFGILYVTQIILSIIRYIFFRREYFPDSRFLKDKSMPLLTCPFCGQDKVEMFKDTTPEDKVLYAMTCDAENGGCGASTGWYENEIDALMMWNTREGVQQCQWVDNRVYDEE